MVKICMGDYLSHGRDCVVVALTRSSCCSIYVAIYIFREMKGVQLSNLLCLRCRCLHFAQVS